MLLLIYVHLTKKTTYSECRLLRTCTLVNGYFVSLFITVYIWCAVCWGTGIRGLMRIMATLPQGNQDLLVVRDKVGRPPGELGVSKSMECDIFPSVV